MTISFYVALPWFFLAIFIAGLILGAVVHRIITAPSKPAKPICYDGTNGRGYQPRRPTPPKPLHSPNK